MTVHKIFHKEFHLWWLAMIVLSVAKFAAFGFPTMNENENYGYIIWTIGTLFTSLVFGSIIYLLYRLIAGKWNNKVFIIIIFIACIGVLLAYEL